MAINLKPTEAMAAEAKLGLEWRAEFNRGGTAVGVARARDISNRTNLSAETIGRMVSYFARHEVDKEGEGFSPGEDGYPSAGRIAWALWGGDPGASWARARQQQLDTETNNVMKLLTIENRVAKVRLNDAVTPWSADDLIADIERSYGQKAVAENVMLGMLQCSADEALETLEIEINSPGGSVLDGYRVYNSLMQMRGRGVEIIATVNTLAASMGSVILMAANKVRIVEGGRIMIHEASQAVAGDSAAHARAAKLLEEISEEIAGIYAKRTGGDPDEMRELMKAETWMGAAEAMERKFADEIVQFDTAPKSMSILSKLFPGNDEALKIEAAIAENDSLRADLTTAHALIQELSGHAETITQLRAELAIEQEKAAEVTEKVEELETKVEELEEKTEVSEEKVSARAAELLAATGHPAPVALAGDNNEAPVSHLKAMASMTPTEAAEYFALHKAEILSDKNRYAV